MKRNIVKRVTSVALVTALTGLLLAGCGGGTASTGASKAGAASGETASGGTTDTSTTLTLDVFDDQANYQGMQQGWFAKIIKDKFNIELNIIAPNVAGGGNTLFETRSANGNLGDIIITKSDESRLKDLVKANLVLDMTPYMANEDSLNKHIDAIKECSSLAEKDGIWSIPSEISNQSATEPCEAQEPTNAPSLRWDLYEAAGSPDIKTLEDMIPVLKTMQDSAGQSDSGKQCYAISLFKDWDNDMMQNAQALCALYGYYPYGFAYEKVDGSDIESAIDSDSSYVRALKFLFSANQAGIVDPESTTQNYDTLTAKYTDGQVLYSLWPWLGAGKYNTSTHTSEGKGFASATIDDMQCVSWGSMPKGKTSTTIMVGSQTKDPQRVVDFVNWLYSAEGIEDSCAATASTCGPEGLTWEVGSDGTPKLTDFGKKAFVDNDSTLTVPDEWGGGTWTDGVSALNYKAAGIVDTDDETGICYNYMRWQDYIDQTKTELSTNWASSHDNAELPIDYFKDNDKLLVMTGTNYAVPEYATDVQAIKEQCKSTIVEYSWKMAFAEDQTTFDSLLKEMQDTVKGLGYDSVYAIDEQNCKDHIAAMKEAASADTSASTGSTVSTAASTSGSSTTASDSDTTSAS